MESLERLDVSYKIDNIRYDDSDKIRFVVLGSELEVLYGQLKKEQVNDKLVYLDAIIQKTKEKDLKG